MDELNFLVTFSQIRTSISKTLPYDCGTKVVTETCSPYTEYKSFYVTGTFSHDGALNAVHKFVKETNEKHRLGPREFGGLQLMSITETDISDAMIKAFNLIKI